MAAPNPNKKLYFIMILTFVIGFGGAYFLIKAIKGSPDPAATEIVRQTN